MDVGAPTKFTEEIREKILEGIGNLLTNKLAAHYAGVCEKTLYNWLQMGEIDLQNGLTNDYTEFLQSIRKVRAEKAMHLLMQIQSCCERWQALDRILGRCYRDEYGYDSDDIREIRAIIAELAARRGINLHPDAHGEKNESV